MIRLIAQFTFVFPLAFASAATTRADNAEMPSIEASARLPFRGDVFEDRDLSGIAMASRTEGLVAADEGAAVQSFLLERDAKQLRTTGVLSLSHAGESADQEFDLEGAAYSDGAYYVVGSHGVAKKSGEIQPSRHRLVRIPSEAAHSGSRAERLSGDRSIMRTSLDRLFEADPLLARHLNRPLQHRGLNVEGIAVRDGRLLIGLRGPNIGGIGFVVSAAIEQLFRGSTPVDAKVHSLQLGIGYGIRDIAAVDNGFLLLLGNSSAEPAGRFETAVDYDPTRPYEIAFWDGQRTEPIRLARLDDAPAKAEALLVLEEHDQGYETLLLFDGAKRGRPSLYHVPKAER